MDDEWRCKDCGQTFEEGPCPVWEARLGDDVNEPRHYNKQGIEVIDVIEAYKLPYKLGNVIKYVLRHQYKDDPIKDLEKARWYLDRTIKEAVALREEEIETLDQAIERKAELYRTFPSTRYEVELPETGRPIGEKAAMGYVETAEDRQGPTYEVDLGPARIAGETPAATDVKDEFYMFDRHAIRGWCAWCDVEIGATQPFISLYDDSDNSYMCCSQKCAKLLRDGGFK